MVLNPLSLQCPLCARPGRSIEQSAIFQNLMSNVLVRTLYWKDPGVCLNSACACLYFNGEEWIPFDLCRKPVGYKQPGSLYPLCYCFRYTREDILKEIKLQGKSPIIQGIRKSVEEGHIWCHIVNPTGACCLEVIDEVLRQEGIEIEE